MGKWDDIGIDIPFGRTSGKVKTLCPKCREGSRRHKLDKSLSVNLDEGLYKCHYCGFSGSINGKKDYNNYRAMKEKTYRKPAWQNNTKLSDRPVRYLEDERKLSQATVRKFRLSEGLHYIPAKGRKCNTLQFPYFLNGEVVNVKYRTGDKAWAIEAGCELILYNLDSTVGEEEVIITEGELDCMSFDECGFGSVVSVPNGANGTAYLDNYIEEYFDDKQTVYIAVDTDRKGIILRNELIRRFGPERCRIVTYGPGCKDANEHLVKYGPESLRIAVANAEEIRIEGIFTLPDIRQQADMLFREGLHPGMTTGHSDFDRLLSFETGRLCVVTGIPSHGKSEFVDEIAVRLNLNYGLKFAYFSPENHPLPYLIAKLVSKFTGKRFDKKSLLPGAYERACVHIGDNFSFIYPEEDFGIDNILEKASCLVRKKGIRGLVIDPYNAIEHQIPHGMNETNYISALLSKLVTFARQKDVLVFLVAHPRKMEMKGGVPTAPNLYDVNGSANFYNKADFGFTVYRDYREDHVRVDVHKVKFRHLGKCGAAYFSYDYANGRYVPFVNGKKGKDDDTDYLDSYYRGSQASIDFTKSAEEPEQAFITDTTEAGDLPF
jgi:twinkle protein